ncbi:MAG: ferrous iron transport protein A [Rhodospirillales bacterium]|jgi:ferrous iron transport protein A
MQSIPIAKARPGSFRISGILLPAREAERLSDLGLRVGGEIRLLQNRGDGGAVLAVGDARLAVDAATAAKVRVIFIKGEEA